MGRHIETGALSHAAVDVFDVDAAAVEFDEDSDMPALVIAYNSGDGDALVLYGNTADLIAFKQRVIAAIDNALEDMKRND